MTGYIHDIRCVGPFDAFPAEALAAWRSHFSSAAARRLTPPGLMLGEVLKDMLGEMEPAIIYATTFSEARTIEKYLDTFPTPSPAFFQTCIHPGGIEQILVHRQCRAEYLLPLAGESAIIAQAVRSALGFEQSLLCGCEDLSEWLGSVAAASNQAFAFALRLGAESSQALGTIRWEPDGTGAPANTAQFFAALQVRDDASFAWPDAGCVHLRWR